MTTGEPWSKFFWADWRADPRLRACCLAARGLWMDLLAVMFEATPRGHLLVNGNTPTDKQIAAMAGATVAEVRKLMRELLEAGVPSIAENGVWFNRRMVRDEHRKTVNRENAAKGGNPALLNNRPSGPRITESDNRIPKQSDNRIPARDTRATQKPEARSQSLPPPSCDAEAPEPLDDAGVVVADFEARRLRHWPHESRLPAPGLTLRTQAEEFLRLGGTPALIGEVMERGMAHSAKLGKAAPGSLAAYGNSLHDAIVNHRQPAAPGASNGRGEPERPKSRNPAAGSPEEAAVLREMGLEP